MPNSANKVICGDCIESMGTLSDGSVDMVMVDPPYGITRCKWDSVIPLEAMWSQIERVAKRDAAIVFTATQPFTSALVMSRPGWFRYSLVWRKTTPTGHLNARRMPLRAHEDIVVFCRGKLSYSPQKTQGHPRKVSTSSHRRGSRLSDNYGGCEPNSYDSTERFPTSVITFKSDKQKSSLHPTQKPVALMEWLIKTYTEPGDRVLDFAAGSGTTGVAAMNCGRAFTLIEKDSKYVEIINSRLDSLLG